MYFHNRLMLVDDDEDDREFFLAALSDLHPNVECLTAVNGKEALQILLREKVKPDLIFLDLNMPLMNGKQFLQERKNHHELLRIPVVIFTTSSDEDTKQETVELGAHDFVTKPDKLSQWKSVLKVIFDKPAP